MIADAKNFISKYNIKLQANPNLCLHRADNWTFKPLPYNETMQKTFVRLLALSRFFTNIGDLMPETKSKLICAVTWKSTALGPKSR